MHLCFGYAALMGDKTGNRYDFLGELSDSVADQISVEAAQPRLDPGQLSELSPKVVVLGVLDLGDPQAESPEHGGRAGSAPRSRTFPPSGSSPRPTAA